MFQNISLISRENNPDCELVKSEVNVIVVIVVAIVVAIVLSVQLDDRLIVLVQVVCFHRGQRWGTNE